MDIPHPKFVPDKESHVLDNNINTVSFTKHQIAWLDKMFPEICGNHATSDAELRFRSGQRSVIAIIRQKGV